MSQRLSKPKPKTFSTSLVLRCSPRELDAVTQQARAAGVGRSEYVRRRLTATDESERRSVMLQVISERVILGLLNAHQMEEDLTNDQKIQEIENDAIAMASVLADRRLMLIGRFK